MTILVVIDSAEEMEVKFFWGYSLAHAYGYSLTLVFRQKDFDEVKEIDCETIDYSKYSSQAVKLAKIVNEYNQKSEQQDSCKLYLANQKTLEKNIYRFIKETDAKVTVLFRDKDKKETDLVRSLYKICPTKTVLINHPKCTLDSNCNILVPASRGKHSQFSLKLASKLRDELKSKFTAVYIEPRGGEDADTVGDRQLQSYLVSAKVIPSEKKIYLEDRVETGLLRAIEENDSRIIILAVAKEKAGLSKLIWGGTSSFITKHIKDRPVITVRDSLPVSDLTRFALDRVLARYIPQLDRTARINLFENLQVGSHWNIDFIALIGLSSFIAAFGLIQNSPAIVIGAMLVAPLMTPMIGAGLGLVQGNLRLTLNASKSIIFGFLTSFTIGLICGLLTISSPTSEILARGAPNFLDLLIAFFSGTAASYAISRPGLSGALPGVAIAAALVPPIVSSGIAASMGDAILAQGAATLFGVNLLMIILSASATLYAVGARPDQQFSTPKIWARRTLVGLMIAAFIVSVPVSTEIFKILTESRPLRVTLENGLAQSEWQLISYKESGNQLIIEVEGEIPFTEQAKQDLARRLIKSGVESTRLKVISTISTSTRLDR